jgi:transposase InsO family protein
MDMTGNNDRIEAITSIQRHRRWSAAKRGGIDSRPMRPEWRRSVEYSALDFKAPQQQVRAAQPTQRQERRGRKGVTEAFVKTFKRHYTLLSPRLSADAVLRKFDEWFTHYNESLPHRALKYPSPRQFHRAKLIHVAFRVLMGQ